MLAVSGVKGAILSTCCFQGACYGSDGSDSSSSRRRKRSWRTSSFVIAEVFVMLLRNIEVWKPLLTDL